MKIAMHNVRPVLESQVSSPGPVRPSFLMTSAASLLCWAQVAASLKMMPLASITRLKR